MRSGDAHAQVWQNYFRWRLPKTTSINPYRSLSISSIRMKSVALAFRWNHIQYCIELHEILISLMVDSPQPVSITKVPFESSHNRCPINRALKPDESMNCTSLRSQMRLRNPSWIEDPVRFSNLLDIMESASVRRAWRCNTVLFVYCKLHTL